MKTLIIGDGSRLGGCVSATTYRGREEKSIRDHVSHNSILFWANSSIFDFHFYIMKDSEEGKFLQNMLDDTSVDDVTILRFIDEIAIKNMPVDKMLSCIEKMKDEAFKSGERSVRHKFRQLIGV